MKSNTCIPAIARIDFVDGVVLERNLGQFDHSFLQPLLTSLFWNNRKNWGVLGLVEQRLRVRRGKYRVPDVLAVPLDYDRSQKVAAIAPLLCIEILSPEDTMPRILERCADYHALGVPETWIFDPETKQAFHRQRSDSEASDGGFASLRQDRN